MATPPAPTPPTAPDRTGTGTSTSTGTGTTEAARPAEPARPGTRSEDILKVHRLARSGGSAALLHWLAGRLGGWTGVLDPRKDAVPCASRSAPEAARRGAAELAARGVRSAALDGDGSAVLLYALDGGRVLAAEVQRPYAPAAPALLADAAGALELVLRAEEAERRAERARLAESRAREAVLHLLMAGRLSTAHQVAETLSPSLPDPMRMYVIESRAAQRAEVARVCRELTGGRAWIVRCPVYVRHLIAFVPTDLAASSATHDPLAEALVRAVPDCVVGVSCQLSLRESPAAHTQAFHALAVARGRTGHHARFGPAPEPELAAHEAGTGWAEAFLAPLHAYEPRRPQDPGGHELRATAHAWLDFSSHATRLLKIHRNTLASRLRLVESVLGTDLARLPEQAALSLALRLTPGGRTSPYRTPAPAVPGAVRAPAAGAAADLDAVLRHPHLAAWSHAQLAPLTGPDAPPGALDTVRAWLRNDTHLAGTASALGLSVPGTRKRLTRIEGVLQRSLLQSPSARYDLWLADRAAELARPATAEHHPTQPDTAMKRDEVLEKCLIMPE
ncbi:helix-turn-helix domain-containing protein [Streptomyces sp. NPDC047718]|uniref:helix-turn-helix domain-containing protein n=1 Tax=Streptomyces sp. NPDC047718 TaxID=3155479 RepID=UPI0033E6683E